MDRNLRIRMLLEAGDRFSRPLRDLSSGAGRAAQALKGTRDRLKEIERAQGDIAGFNALKTGLHETEAAMQAARTKVGQLSAAIDHAEKPTRAMTRDLARAQQELEKLTRQQERETTELKTLTDRLHAAGLGTSALARHERELREQAAATNRELAEQTSHYERLADRERRIGVGRARFQRMQGAATGMAASGAAAIGTGMAMAAPLAAGIRAAQEYESVMTDIGQKADLTREASAQLGRHLLVSARAANQMPADLQAGVDALAGLGAKVPDAVRMMTPIGRAATAYKAEIADLSAAAFAATDNLKVPVAQTGQIIDIMASAGKAGAFEIKDMAQYFPALTAAYQGLGQTGTGAVADLAAGLQIARKGAGDAATAGTNLANILQKIASPATNKAFEKMGVDLPAALKKAYAEGKTPLEAIAELTNKTLKGDLSKLGYLFEDAQVQQGLRPLIQNMEEYRRIRAEAAGATGTTDRDFAERMKDSAEQTKRLKINAMTLGIALGSQLLPMVTAVTEKANAFASWLGDAASRHPALTKAVLVGAAAFTGLFFVLGGGAIVAAGLVAPFSALAFAAGALGMGMLPVVGIALAVTAGIVALGAAAYAIYSNWGAIGGFFSGIWSAVAGAFTRNWTTIRNVLLGAVVIFLPVVAGIALAAKKIYDNWDAIKGAFMSGANFLLSMVTPFVSPILRILAIIGSLAGRFVQAGFNIVQGIATGILGAAGGLLRMVGNLAGRIGARFAAALGIHSPSRVFASFGGFMMEGLDNGIAAGAGAPVRRVGQVSARLTDAFGGGPGSPIRIQRSSGVLTRALAIGASAGIGTASAGGAASGRAAAAPPQFTIHINSSPGQDVNELARVVAKAVADALAEERRITARNAGSTLLDQPDWS